MTIDPRTPVIIGAAAVAQRPEDVPDPAGAADAVGLMARAVRDAATDAHADAGDAAVRAAIDTMGVVGGLWRHRDPARLVADELGLGAVHTILTSFGGNTPIEFTHDLVERIRRGDGDVAVVIGGECNLSRRRQRAEGVEPHRREEPEEAAAEFWGPALDMGDRTAAERGGEHPRNSYAVLESALRARRGESQDACRRRGATLWAGYAHAAVDNPVAVDRTGMTAEEIMTPSPDNRMVSWPYTKAMCANNNVDQAGAVVLTSTEAADRLGVPAERRVYPHLCVSSADTPSPLERAGFPAAPGLEAGARTTVEHAGGPGAIDHLELYSCFPSVVTMTAEALGIPADRPLSVTGGLAFAGAPLNFAAGMGLIGMVAALRADPGSVGLVQGNGGHVSKNAFGLYSTEPPSEPHRVIALGSVGATSPPADVDRAGSAVIDGATVEFGHDGPERAVAMVRFDDGARTWATSTDTVVLDAIMTGECVGRAVEVDAGSFRLAPAAVSA